MQNLPIKFPNKKGILVSTPTLLKYMSLFLNKFKLGFGSDTYLPFGPKSRFLLFFFFDVVPNSFCTFLSIHAPSTVGLNKQESIIFIKAILCLLNCFFLPQGGPWLPLVSFLDPLLPMLTKKPNTDLTQKIMYFLVFVPYCSSDLYSGTANASSVTEGRAFQGKNIFKAIISNLLSTTWLAEAEEVVLAGSVLVPEFFKMKRTTKNRSTQFRLI